MFCSNCGTNNPDGVKFCSSCGNPMPTAPAAPVEPAPVAPVEPVAPVVPVAPVEPVAPASAPAPAPKKKGNNIVIIAIVAVIAVIGIVVGVLFGTGVIGGDSKKEETEETTKKKTETTEENKEEEKEEENKLLSAEEYLVGTWDVEYEVEEGIIIYLDAKFTEDGKFEIIATEEKYEKTIKEMSETYLLKAGYYNYTDEQKQQIFENANCANEEEFMEFLVSEMKAGSTFEEFKEIEVTSTWSLDGDNLTVDGVISSTNLSKNEPKMTINLSSNVVLKLTKVES